MKETKNYIRIQSSIDIAVTPGLQGTDETNEDAHVADRLNIKALWPKGTVTIYKGNGTYPAHIAKWNTVKELAKNKILTIGEYCDGPDNIEDVKVKNNIDNEIEDIKNNHNIILEKKIEDEMKRQKLNKGNIKLSDLAKED